MTDDIIHKDCRKCGRNLPTSEFYKNRSKSDGLQVACKTCQNARRKQNYLDNRESQLESRRQWRINNKEHLARLVKRWSENNPDRRREADRRQRENNPESSRAATHRRRARMVGNGGTLTPQEIRDIVADTCFWCGTDCSEKYELDHIVPISKGGRNSRCNIAVSCPDCNRRKAAKDLSDWLREIGWVKP